ncbi:MAG: hypothetical protein QOF48_1030 [Verrucomicrobiota bacterium]|jgi:outer membrane protein assembly factor BamD (BamD/ComL family)
MVFRFTFGLFILVVFALGVAWVLWKLLKRSYDPARLAFRWILTVGLLVGGYFLIDHMASGDSPLEKAFGVFTGMFLAMVLVVLWGPSVLGRFGELIGNLYTGGGTPPDPVPLYSVAESRRKQGRYREAIWEIQGQLATFPSDVIGQMLIAEIQADNLNDLTGAQLTIERFCAQPGHGPKNIAFALNSLADWHLKYNRDVEAARAAVQKIIDLVPDSESSMQASQRLARLSDADAMAAIHERKPIHMPAAGGAIGLRSSPAPAQRLEESVEDAAARLVKQLEAHPLDAESREKLAAIYSDHYGRLDLAVDQLEQLIAAPNQLPKELARWLNTVADLQVKHGADYETIQATLQRIIEKFPGLAAERLAQQRIEYLRLELKGNDKNHFVDLGSYEKDLGLKKKPAP